MTAHTDGVTTGRSDEPTASPSDTAAIEPTAAEPTAAAVHTVYGSALPTVRPSEAVVRPVVPDDGPRPAIRADATGPAAVDGTMRAIVQDTYGSAGVLRLARINRPDFADSEVLVRVHAAGLDRGTWHLMTGRPYLLRLAAGLRRPRSTVLGRDVAVRNDPRVRHGRIDAGGVHADADLARTRSRASISPTVRTAAASPRCLSTVCASSRSQ